MHNLNIVQALSVWTDLSDAYHGRNKFGGHVAEIYIYRFMVRNPNYDAWLNDQQKFNVGLIHDEAMRALDTANESLYSLLMHFSEVRDADIEIEERALGQWLTRARFSHRVHIEVTPR